MNLADPTREIPGEYERALRHLTLADLNDTLEINQWMLLDPECQDDSNQTFLHWCLGKIVTELERRTKLLERNRDHPLAPTMTPGVVKPQRHRFAEAKARWQIQDFMEQELGCHLQPCGPGKWKTRCPLPGHHDATPSMTVYANKQWAWCYGCHRGGDVIELTRMYLNTTSYMEALIALEKAGTHS